MATILLLPVPLLGLVPTAIVNRNCGDANEPYRGRRRQQPTLIGRQDGYDTGASVLISRALNALPSRVVEAPAVINANIDLGPCSEYCCSQWVEEQNRDSHHSEDRSCAGRPHCRLTHSLMRLLSGAASVPRDVRFIVLVFPH